jgi:hypothetical protein
LEPYFKAFPRAVTITFIYYHRRLLPALQAWTEKRAQGSNRNCPEPGREEAIFLVVV